MGTILWSIGWSRFKGLVNLLIAGRGVFSYGRGFSFFFLWCLWWFFFSLCFICYLVTSISSKSNKGQKCHGDGTMGLVLEVLVDILGNGCCIKNDII